MEQVLTVRAAQPEEVWETAARFRRKKKQPEWAKVWVNVAKPTIATKVRENA